ncbi:MAG TPA: zinc ABC transporter substrate-binding protein [Candidatus Sumerlaeota bacterium]|nr:zinc ABC transporter substrate-binding protein [Candidatus Sumerlaeota bacterium]
MNRIKALCLAALLFPGLIAPSCGHKNENPDNRPVVAVTTSYLECAVLELLGERARILRLAPPGMCPGHYDISPGQVRDLRAAVLILRFDFQQGLDEKIRQIAGNKAPIAAITAPEGLSIPQSYRICVEECHTDLARVFPQWSADLNAAHNAAVTLLDHLSLEGPRSLSEAGLTSATVAASGHQSVFCRWLGLDVAAEYSGEAVTPRTLSRLWERGEESGVAFVVGNLQEGGQTAQAIAARLGKPIAVLSNFPSMVPEQDSFEKMFHHNVNEIIKAGRGHP